MVKPGGTGRPSTDVISARFAPFPPSRSFICMGGLRCLWSKAKTYGMGAPGASGVNSQRAYRRGEGGRDLRAPSLQGDPFSGSYEIRGAIGPGDLTSSPASALAVALALALALAVALATAVAVALAGLGRARLHRPGRILGVGLCRLGRVGRRGRRRGGRVLTGRLAAVRVGRLGDGLDTVGPGDRVV